MKIEESFEVTAPIGETWKMLNDVPAVIPCMPGAELIEVRGDDEWLARLETKVGPMAMTFDTEVTRTEADEASHSVHLAANAKELKGRGRAKAKISSSLDSSGGDTRVSIVTDLQMQGPVAQFGRGVVGEISAQMTREFASCLARQLDPAAAASGEGAAAEPGAAGAKPKPVNGLRLFLLALWRWIVGIFRRGDRS